LNDISPKHKNFLPTLVVGEKISTDKIVLWDSGDTSLSYFFFLRLFPEGIQRRSRANIDAFVEISPPNVCFGEGEKESTKTKFMCCAKLISHKHKWQRREE
jgi:hypothetical protein